MTKEKANQSVGQSRTKNSLYEAVEEEEYTECREVDGDSRHEWIAIYKIFKQKFFIQDHRTKQVYVTV